MDTPQAMGAALLVLTAFACQDKAADTATQQEVIDTAPPVDSADTADSAAPTIPDGLMGSIDFHSFGEIATIDIKKAFGLALDKKFIAYFSSNDAATCEDVIEYVTPTDKAEDPSALLVPGHCDMFMSLEWSDGFEHADDVLYVAGYSIFCPLGDGEFTYEKRDEGDYDYYWSGRWWQGHPEDYQITIAEDEAGYTFTGQMTTFKGNLIYEDLKSYTGTGTVWGVLPIERCEALTSVHKIY